MARSVWGREGAGDLRQFNTGPGGVRRATFSADGSRMAWIGGDASWSVWDFGAAHPRRYPAPKAGALDIALARDGRRVALARPRAVYLHDAATGTFGPPLPGPPYSVGQMAFAPDGRLAAAIEDDVLV
jgi:hypothetical protein